MEPHSAYLPTKRERRVYRLAVAVVPSDPVYPGAVSDRSHGNGRAGKSGSGLARAKLTQVISRAGVLTISGFFGNLSLLVLSKPPPNSPMGEDRGIGDVVQDSDSPLYPLHVQGDLLGPCWRKREPAFLQGRCHAPRCRALRPMKIGVPVRREWHSIYGRLASDPQ